MKHLLWCPKCKIYTISKKCACGAAAISPKPPKYSPEDPYGSYRRKVKIKALEQAGLL